MHNPLRRRRSGGPYLHSSLVTQGGVGRRGKHFKRVGRNDAVGGGEARCVVDRGRARNRNESTALKLGNRKAIKNEKKEALAKKFRKTKNVLLQI